MSTKGSDDGRPLKSKQSAYTSSHEDVPSPKKIEPPPKKEEKKVIQIKKTAKVNPMDRGNFVKSKQMTFGQDKKLAPSSIYEDQRMWQKPGGIHGYDDSSHQTF